MAGSKSDWLENKVLQMIFKSAWSFEQSVWVGLYTVAPTDAGGGTAATGTGYARIEVARSTGWTLTGNTITNTADVDFGTAGGSWGTVVAFGIFDALTAGNLLYWGDLTVSKTIQNGDPVKFPAGTGITISED